MKKTITSFSNAMAELGNITIEITQEEIDADLFGVRQDANATVDLHSV